jgi:hypothetical protein
VLESPAVRIIAAVLALVASANPAFSAREPAALQRGLSFWTELARDCAVPEGETAFGLVQEALELLGHPDSTWRDDVGWGVVARCVYRDRTLDPSQRRELIEVLSANLRRGIGETGSDAVLLRSFSALDLATFAALENEDPALDAAGFRRLWDAALAYLLDERDVRGFEPRVGWIHTAAHTADLLKFLARNPHVERADQRRLFEVVTEKLTRPGTPVFAHAEDERLAAALLSVARREDFDATLLDAWLEGFVAREQSLWSKPPPDPERLAAAQNGRNLLRSFHLLLAFPEPAPTAGQQAARDAVLQTLARIRR